ncbi:hypothetical protein OGH69_10825 [Flavobacterium sp. MFBS3-15]|uniref:hypothetical protein n=1 Tax=Flavobacterium sp. MFBS3-15 TaxID=2989816 RepID=UPI0022368F36|nr:hypothetical protein [Flavobacterium sp. MFBS3-15]MCW4469460.1 hypothetical protein [Flavobacterium sp. MFBS3-15]
MTNNFINLEIKDLDLNIYRIYPLSRFMDMMKNNSNVLVKTSLWEDPFENFILNSTGRLPTGQTFTIGSRDQYFGQCWSYKKESDAMWRIYSQHIKDSNQNLIVDNIGIKVKSTIRNVFEPLFTIQRNAINPYNGGPYNLCSFIGKVKYLKKQDLVTMLRDNASELLIDQSGKGQASTLMLKRLAFTHEREIRIVYHNDQCQTSDKVYPYPIDPNKCFQEIVVDPRIPKDVYLEIKKIIKQSGFKNRIIQSGLYKIEDFMFDAKFL